MKAYSMTWLRIVYALLGGLSAVPVHALTPLYVGS